MTTRGHQDLWVSWVTEPTLNKDEAIIKLFTAKLCVFIYMCVYNFIHVYVYNKYILVPLTLLSFLYSVTIPVYLKAFVKICEMLYNLFQTVQAIFNWIDSEGTLEGEWCCRKALSNSFKPNIWGTLSLQIDLSFSLAFHPLYC